MADISVTAANVIAASGSTTKQVTFGATVTAGQPVYKDTADSNEYKPTDADAEASALVEGIALCGGADGQPGVIITAGNLNAGATLVVGQTYVVSATAGGIAPISDLLSGDYVSVLGVASTASNLELSIFASGTAKA